MQTRRESGESAERRSCVELGNALRRSCSALSQEPWKHIWRAVFVLMLTWQLTWDAIASIVCTVWSLVIPCHLDIAIVWGGLKPSRQSQVNENALLREENARLRSESSAASEEVEAVKARLRAAETAVAALKERLDQKEALLQELRQLNSETSQSMQMLVCEQQSTIHGMCAQHADAQRQLTAFQAENRELKHMRERAALCLKEGAEALQAALQRVEQQHQAERTAQHAWDSLAAEVMDAAIRSEGRAAALEELLLERDAQERDAEGDHGLCLAALAEAGKEEPVHGKLLDKAMESFRLQLGAGSSDSSLAVGHEWAPPEHIRAAVGDLAAAAAGPLSADRDAALRAVVSEAVAELVEEAVALSALSHEQQRLELQEERDLAVCERADLESSMSGAMDAAERLQEALNDALEAADDQAANTRCIGELSPASVLLSQGHPPSWNADAENPLSLEEQLRAMAQDTTRLGRTLMTTAMCSPRPGEEACSPGSS